MTFQEIQEKIQQHLKTAYDLLSPSEFPELREMLFSKFQKRQNWWREVRNIFDSCRMGYGGQTRYVFSQEVLHELALVEEYVTLYEQAGYRNVLSMMTEQEIHVIGEWLRAAAYGSFFPESEFYTLFGLERDEVTQIADTWPEVVIHDDTVGIAINNAIVTLLWYPHNKFEEEWGQFLSVSPEECGRIYGRWRELTGQDDSSELSSWL